TAAGACLLLLGTALLGCTATITTPEQGPEPSASPGTSATADTGGGLAALPAACHLQLAGALPDMACAPGATDPAVTQANVCSTTASARARCRWPTRSARSSRTGWTPGTSSDRPRSVGNADQPVGNADQSPSPLAGEEGRPRPGGGSLDRRLPFRPSERPPSG